MYIDDKGRIFVNIVRTFGKSHAFMARNIKRKPMNIYWQSKRSGVSFSQD